MSLQRLIAASILVVSTFAFAADPAPEQKPADNPAPPRQQQPPPQRQQPQRPLPLFGQNFFGQRDAFSEGLTALGDLALTPNFTITNEQKESIQSLKLDHKLAVDKWRGEHAEELGKLSEEAEAARESGDRQKLRDIFQKRRNLMNAGPKPEDALKKLMGLLNEEQRTKLDERIAQRRAEEEAQLR